MDRLIRPFRLTHGFAFIISSVAFTGSAHATLAEQQAILKQYCISCHSAQVKSGGLALSTQDLANPGAHGAVYEKVVRKLRAGVMPPVGVPRPPKPAYEGFASWLESELDSAASAHPNPGRTEALHRLNRQAS
jgi:mono/diheme cytochrome c family protein